MRDFRRALPILLRVEGGYKPASADPDDHGGDTNLGITQRAYDRWLLGHELALRPVAVISEQEAAALYWSDYWMPAKCEQMPWPLNLIHFDCVVNDPMAQAVRLLQRALGVQPDGILGPITLSRCAPAGPRDCYRYLLERAFHYRALAHADRTQWKYLVGGWMYRLEVLYAEVA